MSLSIQGTEQLMKRLNAIPGKGVLRDLQIRTVREAKLRVPRKTGQLGRSIHPGTLTNTYALVEASTNYAAAVEFGTKPHTIRPRTRKALAWPATAEGRRLSGRARTATRAGGLGGMAFATLVHHPGTKKQPFLIPGAKEAIRQVGADAIVDAWNSVA